MPAIDQAVAECDIFLENAFAVVHNTQIDTYNANMLQDLADTYEDPAFGTGNMSCMVDVEPELDPDTSGATTATT